MAIRADFPGRNMGGRLELSADRIALKVAGCAVFTDDKVVHARLGEALLQIGRMAIVAGFR